MKMNCLQKVRHNLGAFLCLEKTKFTITHSQNFIIPSPLITSKKILLY